MVEALIQLTIAIVEIFIQSTGAASKLVVFTLRTTQKQEHGLD